MTDIEVEEYFEDKCGTYFEATKAEIKEDVCNAFKDGYNKANEWHYVKDGDLPRNDTKVLVLLENKRLKISTFMKNMFTLWNRDYDTYTKLYDVYAWKEIVLPEESKE